MHVTWQSRQGVGRSSNNDAAAVGYTEYGVMAVVVDAAEDGDGAAFAQHWARSIVIATQESSSPLDGDSLRALINAEQDRLRSKFSIEKAAYCCVFVDLRVLQVEVLYAGDCQLGILKTDESVTWITVPHTLSRQAELLGISAPVDARHVLTRCLRMLRTTCRAAAASRKFTQQSALSAENGLMQRVSRAFPPGFPC
ncbi:hypothetical protein, partial [Pseudomonas oryzihabitans]|uniref:hypothetical protein n=1 Tax=Pseudomonas oryzihabitans TaxID=47885 RepID=UPI001C614D02